MPDPLDPLAGYAQSKGYTARARTVLVEGTTDFDLFELAARFEREVCGKDLLSDLAFIPAGQRDQGGTSGVGRELIGFRAVASTVLLPNGRPRYRIAALFDNDKAGRGAIRAVRQFDVSIVECRDVFLLLPEMPPTANRDPIGMKRMLEAANAKHKGLDWEPEDLLPRSFLQAFEEAHVNAIARKTVSGERVHHDFTADGKARFHHFIKENAMYGDMVGIIEMLRSLRCYLGLTM